MAQVRDARNSVEGMSDEQTGDLDENLGSVMGAGIRRALDAIVETIQMVSETE